MLPKLCSEEQGRVLTRKNREELRAYSQVEGNAKSHSVKTVRSSTHCSPVAVLTASPKWRLQLFDHELVQKVEVKYFFRELLDPHQQPQSSITGISR